VPYTRAEIGKILFLFLMTASAVARKYEILLPNVQLLGVYALGDDVTDY
jgi:hypothetical protein